MNPDYEDLIQRELDDQLGPQEQARLLAAVADDPEVAAHREAMQGLGADLAALAWCEPPADLPDRVMETVASGSLHVPARRSRAARPRAGWRPGPREILAFAAGIVLMVAVGQVLPQLGPPTLDERQATGTLMPSGALDRGSLGTAGARAEAWTERDADRLVLHVRGETTTVAPVRIEWNGPAWSVSTVRSVPPGDLRVDSGNARFVQARPGPFTLELEFQLRARDTPTGDVRLRFEGSGGGDPPLTLGTAGEVPDR